MSADLIGEKNQVILEYQLNFDSMRQFYIKFNIEKKKPQKCKKCEMTHFWATKSLKGGHFFFLIKDEFFEDFDENMHKFLGQFLSKSPFCPTSETPSGRIQCNV